MTDSQPDYTTFTLEELRDVQGKLDAEAYPERAKQVELLIRDREKAATREPQRVSIADEDGNIAAIKPGRGVSFGRGIAEITGSLGLLAFTFFGFIDSSKPNMRAFAILMAFFAITGVITGAFHLYNAFADRRFTERDIVASGKEPDPFGRMIGKE